MTMNRLVRTGFTIAAGLALTLVALPARADDHRDCDRHGTPPPAAYPARPVYQPAVPAPVVAPTYRHAGWRGQERQELRREYRRLESARDRFYATWDHNPWSRNRFETWYGTRRAELDRRWGELERW